METGKIKKENFYVPLISALLIVIIGNLKIDWYFKSVLFPFIMLVLCSIILVMDNKEINKKAYFMLIPIFLIILSNVILNLVSGGIDDSNKILNVVILPILISIFLFLLINKNYKVSLNNIPLMFKLFPEGVFKNLKFIKPNITKDKNKKVVNIILGLIIGFMVASVILFLLIDADDYFKGFMNNIMISVDIDYGIIISFIIYFIILFSIGINLIKSKNMNIVEQKYKNIDNTIIITMLSVINFVFILFLVSEISKLCGNFLQIPKGYIYSSYAREGFFQLLFVTIINFSIIAYLMYKTKSIQENKIVKTFILILIAFSILLIFNSYYRMFLYIGKFGFTVLRLQVILFLAMEIILFGIITKKILNGLKNDGLVLLIVMICFYIINLYLCNNWFINMINK